ncbi:MAG: hypothetical protein ACE37K_15630 [Planctomycetota bacterium]
MFATLARLEERAAKARQAMQAAGLPEEYLDNMISYDKHLIAAMKIRAGNYDEVKDPIGGGLFGTPDTCYSAYQSGDRHLRIRYTRAESPQLFEAIDARLSLSQDGWDEAVEEFNKLPEHERTLRISENERIEGLLGSLDAELAKHKAGSHEWHDVSAKRMDLRRRKSLQGLPFFMRRDGDTNRVSRALNLRRTALKK